MNLNNKGKLFIKSKSLQNFFIPLVFILTLFLVLFNKTDYFLAYKIKTLGIDVINPVAKIISYPVQFTSETVNYIYEIQYIKSENNRLKEEIKRLKKWQTLAIKNTSENQAFKKLLNSTTNNLQLIKTASVISQSPNIYSKFININAGTNDQILKNYAAINERGLVGKTIAVSENNSKILLINDQNSSIPVKLIDGDFYAIINGSNDGKYLVSSFIKNNNKPVIGDILVTSGNANIYPAGVLVGKIIKINHDKIVAIPFVDLKNIEFVQIIKNN